jgi:LPXTG-motif cell wall-anchored protein
MTPTRFFFLFSLLVLTSFSLSTQAQKKPTIKARVDRTRILIGEPLVLTIESRIPGGAVVRPVVIDTIPHFEFSQAPKLDTSQEGDGIVIRGIYSLTSFDSGRWVIPSFSLSSQIKTDTIPVDVVFSEFDPNQPYHDIKDIIEVEAAGKKRTWWFIIAGGALLLLLLVLWLTRKKKKPMIKPEVKLDAYEEAMKELVVLEKENPDARRFHSRLAEISRLYVYRRKGILSLQKTTDDLMLRLLELKPDKIKFDRFAQALRLSDFVKFAKYSPSAEDNKEALLAIRQGIEEFERLN